MQFCFFCLFVEFLSIFSRLSEATKDYVICSKDWNILLTSDSLFFKAKFISEYYWIGTIEKKAIFSSFCMVGNNPSDSSNSAGIPVFQVISVTKQKFNLQWKKWLKTNLSPLIKNLTYSVSYMSKRISLLQYIKAKTFDVSSLMLVKKLWYCGMLFVCSIFLDRWSLKTWVKH